MSNIDQIEIQEENIRETPTKTTYVALVVDESSSMGVMAEQAISLFNENLQTMKIEGKANNVRNIVSLIKFASEVEVVHGNVELDEIDEVDNQTYIPNGMTAMYDGIGTAINILKGVPNYDNQDVSFLVLVITDGEENFSTEFSGNQLSEWITELESADRWTFTVLGANIDLTKLRKTLGIQLNNVQSFNFNKVGFQEGSRLMACGLSSYYSARSQGLTRVDDFYNNSIDQSITNQPSVSDFLNRAQGTTFTENNSQNITMNSNSGLVSVAPEYSSYSNDLVEDLEGDD